MKRIPILACMAVAFGAATPANAYLGSFEQSDGYDVKSGTILGDVSLYNAGAFGPNAGGGFFNSISADTGLWKLVSPAGSYFGNQANRNAVVSAGPPYNPNPANGLAAYIVGNHFGGRNGGTALALRNESVGTGPIEYDYTIDTFDTGGVAPASVTSGTVSTDFFFCPNPLDPPDPSGASAKDKFIMSFTDSSSSIGLQLGYARDNEVFWRAGNSGLWNYTGVIADQNNYDGFQVDIDLSAGTFGIDFFDFSTSNTLTLAPLGTLLGNSMQDLTHLGWWLDDNLSLGVGGKNFFDDFSVTVPVPEPTSLLLLGCGGLFLSLQSRRRHR